MHEEYLLKYRIPLILGSIGLLCFIIFVIVSISDLQKNKELESGIELIEEGSQVKGELSEMIYIDIQGAVEKPGVYEIEENARIIDLISKAGGYSSEADMDWVSKNVNQAQLLHDGTKLYIPFEGENILETAFEDEVNGLININTASITDLESLNGIGEKRAQQIIEGRPYSSIQELQEKGIVGEKTFEAIKDQISVY